MAEPPRTRLSLDGLHAVVTGAGRGIGASIADELARLGAPVTLMGRSLAELEHSSERIRRRYGRRAHVERIDVCDSASVQAAFDHARAVMGKPAILVNNAGAAESAPFRKTDPTLWERMLTVNLTGTYYCIRCVLDDMLEAGFGRIVNIASTAGLKGYPYVTAYAAAKHGVIGLTRSLAREVAGTGVTVNAVCPGYTDTELLEGSAQVVASRTGRSVAEARAMFERTNPMRRLLQPDEVAAVVGWLCLPSAAALCGLAIPVDAGELA